MKNGREGVSSGTDSIRIADPLFMETFFIEKVNVFEI